MIVVDANVIAYLWLPGEWTEAAEALLARDPQWVVPLLWRSEFRSVLAGAVKKKACSLERAIQIAEAAESSLLGREFAVDSARVLTLAADSGCSSYDCEYVALAKELATALVTNDHELLKRHPRVAQPLGSPR